MKWFKVYAEIIHDPKIRALAYEDRWHFVALMALTCDGTLDEPAELRDELVSVALGLHGVDLEKVKSRLMRLRLIGDGWKPLKWEKRQNSSDPRAAERMRRYRASVRDEKSLSIEADSSVTRNVTDVLRLEERTKNKEEKNMPSGQPEFDQFWLAYPRKVKKPEALKAWKATAKDRPPLPELLDHLSNRAWPSDPKFIPHPSTFLRGHQWADDLITDFKPRAAAGAWR